MDHLYAGQFYGQTKETVRLNGIILTDTVYTHDRVDWHYHENPYFTFLLQGNLREGNKKEVYNCSAGTLLFHNWQEPHYNIKPEGFARGFHIELEPAKFSLDDLQGNINVEDPAVKLLMYRIFKEVKRNDAVSELAVEALVREIIVGMKQVETRSVDKHPVWVKKVKEILHDRWRDRLSLAELSGVLGIHPVHLSRDFSKYFYCGLGEYVRRIKIEKALALLSNKRRSLTDIGLECGFSDQSHFTRCFKAFTGIGPLEYRKMLLSC